MKYPKSHDDTCSTYANISKQAALLDGVDVGLLKWRVCGCGLNCFVHEGMNGISNVKVHLKTHSGNVNISTQMKKILCHRISIKPAHRLSVDSVFTLTYSTLLVLAYL